MKGFIDALYRKNSLLAGLGGLGPLVLLSSRLVYSLSFTVVVLVYSSFMLLCTLLIERFMEPSFQKSSRFFVAAVIIASIDMLMTAIIPHVRADIGVLLPLLLGATGISLLPLKQEQSPIPDEDNSADISAVDAPRERSQPETAERVLVLLGQMLGHAIVLNFLGFVRELVAYGKIN